MMDQGVQSAGETCPTVAGPTRDAATVRPPSTRYRILAELGRGGMGVVYRALDRNLGREVALKVVSPNARNKAALLARFEREARATGQLQHPGIVPLYDFGTDAAGQVFFTMRLIEGRTLQELTQDKSQKLSLFRRLQIFIEVCRTVQYAHQRGVVHRDLKPQNVMVGSHGEVQVLDWGLAKLRGQSEAEASLARYSVPGLGDLTEVGSLLGTPEYMAPEQMDSAGEVGPVADIYSLGAMLYSLLAGRPPFRSFNRAVLLHQVREMLPKPPQNRHFPVPPELQAICLRALAKHPDGRYESAYALADEVQGFLENTPVRAMRGGWRYSLRLFYRRQRRLVHAALLGCALLALVCGAFFHAASAQRAARRERHATEVAQLRARCPEADPALLLAEMRARLLQAEALGDPAMSEHERRTNGSEVSRLVRYLAWREELLRRRLEAPMGAELPEQQIEAEYLDIAEQRELAAALATANRDFAQALLIVDQTHASIGWRREHRARVVAARERLITSTLEATAAALADVRQGLERPGRPSWGPTRQELLIELSGFDHPRVASYLSERLAALAGQAHWPAGERAELALIVDVLGYLDLPQLTIPALSLGLRLIEDEDLVIRLGLALCNTRQPEAEALVLAQIRDRFGRKSEIWRQVKRHFGRLPQAGSAWVSADEHRERGMIAFDRSAFELVWQSFDRAIALDPGHASDLINRALAANALGRPDDALRDMDNAVALAPDAATVYVSRGNLLLSLGRLDEALTDFDRALEHAPEVGAQVGKGIALIGSDRAAEAEAILSAALELHAGHALVYHNRGVARHEQGLFEAAIGDYEQALALDPQLSSALAMRAEACLRLGRLQQAQQSAARAVELEPQSAIAHHRLGLVLRALGDSEAALRAWASALRCPDAEQVHVLADRGRLLLELGRYEEARIDLDRQLERDPNPEIYALRAFVWSELGEPQKCIDDCTTALTLEPSAIEALLISGLAHTARGATEEALEAYDAVLARAADSPEYRSLAGIQRGYVLLERGALEDAIVGFSEALRYGAVDRGYIGRGLAFYCTGQLERAADDFLSALRCHPDNFEVRYLRGIVLREQGLWEGAEADFALACKLDPEHAGLRNDRGQALLELGRWEAAARELDSAVELEPTLIPAYNNKALVLEHQGRLADALATLDCALLYAPEHAQILEYRERLHAKLQAGQAGSVPVVREN